MSNNRPILVTGAAGKVGSVGLRVVKLLREPGLQHFLSIESFTVTVPGLNIITVLKNIIQ